MNNSNARYTERGGENSERKAERGETDTQIVEASLYKTRVD